ncbi:MAG: TonB-dependent receptor [Prolixibacteraceae bacterium]|nr:TonB-dependent receptor [Prolixibacteraceae bacterium]
MKKNRTYGLKDDIGLLKMSKLMRFTIFILLLSFSQAFAVNPLLINSSKPYIDKEFVNQAQKAVSGKVTDSSGAPLTGVTVVIKGTTTGIITDSDGKYSLSNVPPGAILVFSFIGMKTQDVAVAGKTTINVAMDNETVGIEEVVAIGYGVQKRVNVVGSVISISGSSIQSIPSSSTSTAIAGRLPGVVVIQKNGEPGNTGAQILVRGRGTLGSNTGPLVIIDGVQGRSMNDIDPSDISSLSVLKDASAAIYGAQAANGVILITTKKGESGKPRLNYNFYQGFMTPTVIPVVCDAAEYATMISEYQSSKGATRTFSDADIALFKSGADPWGHPNTNWYGDLIKKWTTTSRHNLTIDGGFKGMTYYVSLGFKGDESMYKQSSTSYKQYNIRAKLDLPITDWLKAGIETAAFQLNRLYPYKSQDAIVGQSTRLVPTSRAYWPNGLPGPDIEYGDNPVVTSTFAGGKNDQKTYTLQNTFNVTITPPFVKGLAVNANFNYDVINFYSKRFYQPWILYYPNWNQVTKDPNTGFITDMVLSPTLRGLSSSQNEEDYKRTISQTGNINLTYAKKIGNHDLSIYAGYEQYTNNNNSFYGFRQYYISNLIQTMSAGGDLNKNTTGSMYIYARRSLIGRATYNYKEKYLAEFLFRRDGSLKFPPKSRWGNFPGFLLGWRASEEDFWKNNISFISYFKLRASYGVMGMDPGDPFQYMNKFTLAPGMVFGTASNIETVVGPPTVANPNITWETQTTRNIGFESKFMKELFHLNLEYFFNKRENILAPRNASVPDFTGLSLPNENIARVDNQGFEIEAGVHKKIRSDLRFDLTGNFSFNRNKVVFMDEPAKSKPWQSVTGHPYGAWLMYDAIGVFANQAAVDNYPHWAGAQPGDIIFRDVSGDGKINADDKILIDHTDAPEVFYGINLDATWRNFTLSVLVQGQGKYLRLNVYDDRRGEDGNYFKWTYDNRWTPENTVTNIGRAYSRGSFYWEHSTNMSTYWLDNVAYARLKNVVLSYNLPKRIYKSLGIANARIYFSGNDLGLIYSATKKFDPEVDGQGVYPAMRTFAFGANITF